MWRWETQPSLATLVWLLSWCLATEALPHIDDCNYCFKCHTGEPEDIGRRRVLGVDSRQQAGINFPLRPAQRGPAHRVLLSKASSTLQGDEEFISEDFSFRVAPLDEEWKAKSLKPNCTECYGCSTQVEPLKKVSVQVFGQKLKTDTGASPEWLLFADLPETAQTGQRAIVKVWCMPYDKVSGQFKRSCVNSDLGKKAVQFLLAQQRVMEECGLLDVTIKVWIDRINAVLPDLGFHVWWDGLWMEKAEGVSVHQLAYKTKRDYLQTVLKDLLTGKLNRTRVVRSAIYDLLTSQCDRHAENVFMNLDGNFKLIDNLQALQHHWLNCAVDSIFVPGTQKFEIARWGGSYVFKMRGARPRRTFNPLVLLDYRCYVEGGAIGTRYPPQVQKCLNKLKHMSPDQVQQEYGFPDLRNAKILQQRASDMISKGFEWTAKYGLPKNFAPRQYRFSQPCCNVEVDNSGLKCVPALVSSNVSLPIGDPLSGGDWKKTYPDIGSYVGGTHNDENVASVMEGDHRR